MLVTAGATEAIAATLLALLDEGDEVVTLEPFYDSYGAMIALARAKHVTVPLRAPDFHPDLDELRAAVTDRTRVILLNSPHNPTGAVLDRQTLELIVELANQHDAIIVTDEVYEHLVFDPAAPHIPIASLPGAAERTVTISSGGKTFSTTGWKIGWLIAPPAIRDAIVVGQAVPHLRERRAVPAGDRRGPRPARCLFSGCRGSPRAPLRSAVGRPAIRRVRGLPSGRRILRGRRRHPARVSRCRRASAGSCRVSSGSSPSR